MLRWCKPRLAWTTWKAGSAEVIHDRFMCQRLGASHLCFLSLGLLGKFLYVYSWPAFPSMALFLLAGSTIWGTWHGKPLTHRRLVRVSINLLYLMIWIVSFASILSEAMFFCGKMLLKTQKAPTLSQSNFSLNNSAERACFWKVLQSQFKNSRKNLSLQDSDRVCKQAVL